MRTLYLIFASALFGLCAVQQADADNCQLKMVASVATETDNWGGMFLPGNFGGTQKLLLVDTGGFFHKLRAPVVKELNLTTRESQMVAVVDVLGNETSTVARAPTFSIGAMAPSPMDFVIDNNGSLLGDDRIAGLFAPGVYYRSLDVDLDFANHKFGLFMQDHCPGQVVYWPNSGVAVVPFQLDSSNHIAIAVKIDGHELIAILDSGASQTTMYLRAAHRLGVDETSAGVTETGQLGDNSRVRTYERTFGSISIEGIMIRNPKIQLIPELRGNMPLGPSASGNDTRLGARRHDTTDMLLGMSILRHLHVYIAAKEQKLYITAGAARPAAAAAAAPADAVNAPAPTQK